MHHPRALLALILLLAAPAAFAAQCEVTVEANDAMQYDTDRIEVSQSCETFTVTLEHVGQLPRAAMGHDWVLSTTADKQGVVNDGIAAGIDKGYVKPDDERVIAATDLIGGGEQTTVTFDPSELEEGGDYSFYCTFPGHASVMTGKLVVTD
ncbi:Azurin [wastewater metagenome]|uniref:Azurin n=2 Tax=unclassified sequences TaxID=12908 RepID=A0A5B8R5Q2_9ZZZZ|nr:MULTISPECIES: azurin [Arhodomonas]MCS4502696.1 azurin [Arhodomonas aquaeolei]QEA03821.1 azurin [uncultured organism]